MVLSNSRRYQTSVLNSGVLVARTKLVSPSGGGPTTLVNDTFTDTDGTAITSHTPDTDVVAGGWSLLAGTIGTISSNTAIPGGTALREVYVIDAGTADVTISADCTWYQNTLVVGHYNGLAFRVTDSSNFFIAGFNDTLFGIFKFVGGSYSTVDSTAFTAVVTTTYTISVTISGNSLSASLGAFSAAGTDSDLNGATSVGLVSYRNRTKWDNLLVTG